MGEARIIDRPSPRPDPVMQRLSALRLGQFDLLRHAVEPHHQRPRRPDSTACPFRSRLPTQPVAQNIRLRCHQLRIPELEQFPAPRRAVANGAEIAAIQQRHIAHALQGPEPHPHEQPIAPVDPPHGCR